MSFYVREADQHTLYRFYVKYGMLLRKLIKFHISSCKVVVYIKLVSKKKLQTVC